jgi:membrane protease YdiL (CAAX protease family)
LESGLGPLRASLLLGVVWAVWHLPLFFIATSAQHGTPFALYALLAVPLSLLMTWIYHRSGNSLLLVMLFHAAVNTWSGTLQIGPDVAGSIRPLVLVVIATWCVTLVIVGRGGLAWQPSPAEVGGLSRDRGGRPA